MDGSTHLFSRKSLYGQVEKSKLSVNEWYYLFGEVSYINWWSFSSRPTSNISYMLKYPKSYSQHIFPAFFLFIWFWFQFQLRVDQHKQQPYFCFFIRTIQFNTNWNYSYNSHLNQMWNCLNIIILRFLFTNTFSLPHRIYEDNTNATLLIITSVTPIWIRCEIT